MAEALTQAEIDALLRGEAPPPPAEDSGGPSTLTPDEEDAIKIIQKFMSEAGGDVFSTLLGHESSMTAGDFQEVDAAGIAGQLYGDMVLAQINYKGYVQGQSDLVFTLEDAAKIATQMTGGGTESEFGDLEESALAEAVQSVYSSVNTKLAQRAGGEIQLDSPDVYTKPQDIVELLPESPSKHILIPYQMEGPSISGTVYQVVPRNLLQSIANALGGGPSPHQDEESFMPRGASGAPEILSQPAQFMPSMGGMGGGQGMGMMDFGGGPSVDTRNLELILDIKLEIKVELGRTKRKIRDVLELGPGSVIELDKLAGEPVDILVNDKLFAKGEVVVIDENFGVRITDILTIQERIEALK
ncbi:MAG: flagellar motor switch protein FliN [bacterium]|nr:flagellar motor switch protein FliN [bacterium]